MQLRASLAQDTRPGELRLIYSQQWEEIIPAPKFEWLNVRTTWWNDDNLITLTYDEYHEDGVVQRIVDLWPSMPKMTLLMNGLPCGEFSCSSYNGYNIARELEWWQPHQQLSLSPRLQAGPYVGAGSVGGMSPVKKSHMAGLEYDAMIYYKDWLVQNKVSQWTASRTDTLE